MAQPGHKILVFSSSQFFIIESFLSSASILPAVPGASGPRLGGRDAHRTAAPGRRALL